MSGLLKGMARERLLIGKPGWRHLLRVHGPRFTEWLREEGQLLHNLQRLAPAIGGFLIARIPGPGEALAIWAATPAIMQRCDEQNTYELPMAAEAYAWLHLLDRYVRAWHALEEMVRARYLPLGRYGVNILDIGAGPGPAALAAEDFYRALRTFAAHIGECKLVQETSITCIEFSQRTNSFRHHMVEYLGSYLGLAHALRDFKQFDPPSARERYCRSLLSEEYFNEIIGEREPIYTDAEAHNAAQGLHRYRLVILSNFLTKPEIVDFFKKDIRTMLEDLRPGAVVMLIGALGGQYPKVYELFQNIASSAGLESCLSEYAIASAESPEVQDIIYDAQMQVYQHITALAPEPLKYVRDITEHFTSSESPRRWKSRSALLAFRKPGK